MEQNISAEIQPPIKQRKSSLILIVISFVALVVLGLLIVVFYQNSLIKKQMASIEDLTQTIQYSPTTSPKYQTTPTITEEDYSLFPKISFMSSEGTVRIEDPYNNDFTNNKIFC